jgi:hypothetical protein
MRYRPVLAAVRRAVRAGRWPGGPRRGHSGSQHVGRRHGKSAGSDPTRGPVDSLDWTRAQQFESGPIRIGGPTDRVSWVARVRPDARGRAGPPCHDLERRESLGHWQA